MKIGVITCHAVFNYGAALQAFALSTYLQECGHSVETINYIPEYFNHRYNFWYRNPKSRFYKIFKLSKVLFLPFALYNYYIKQLYKRVKPFREFEHQYLKLSKLYTDCVAIVNDYPGYDCVIAGSDQIWNSFLSNGKDPAFYLEFAPKGVRRVAYAASFGSTQINQEFLKEVSSWLKKIDYLSVRESSGVGLLNQCGVDGVQVMDPVFLLTSQEWIQKLPIRKFEEDYIIVYDLSENNTDIADYAKWLSGETGYKIISVNDRKQRQYADKNINDAGPVEFLSYLAHADYVVTTSFHASALSLIFEKELYTFSNKGANNSNRMAELLALVGVDSRFNPEQKLYPKIDYSKVNMIKRAKIIESKKYLNNSIDG